MDTVAFGSQDGNCSNKNTSLHNYSCCDTTSSGNLIVSSV